jgi:hypothetical protein
MRAGMSAYMSASKVVWGLKRVASEPPSAPGCYSLKEFKEMKSSGQE